MLLLSVSIEGGIAKISLVAIFALVDSAVDIVLAASAIPVFFKALLQIAIKIIALASLVFLIHLFFDLGLRLLCCHRLAKCSILAGNPALRWYELLQIGDPIHASHRIQLRVLHLRVLHLKVWQRLALILLVVLLKVVLHYYYKAAR